ncbi:hypothetical protein COOONC_15965 [Cooperia oncophora]
MHEERSEIASRPAKRSPCRQENLMYTECRYNEIQRLGNIVPLNLLHETVRPVQVLNFELPEKTGIVAQISYVFPDSRAFNPSRFIDENGKLKKVDEFIPFSIGKRQCLGEGLAKMELFLFIANLFNRFELSCVNPDKPPSMKKSFGTTIQTLPYHCLARPRF